MLWVCNNIFVFSSMDPPKTLKHDQTTFPFPSATSELRCEGLNLASFLLLEGESLHFVPYVLQDSEIAPNQYTWFRINSSNKLVVLPSNENERIHYHGSSLLLLNATQEDSGCYIARWRNYSDQPWENYYVKVKVVEAHRRNDKLLFHGSLDVSGSNTDVVCPDPVSDTCQKMGGVISWQKVRTRLLYMRFYFSRKKCFGAFFLQNFNLIPGRREPQMWLYNVTPKDEGVYTCVCTWIHRNNTYRSSGSRELKVKCESARFKKNHQAFYPFHFSPLTILSPTKKEMLIYEGDPVQLNCSVFCGINVHSHCSAKWQLDGKDEDWVGYAQNTDVSILPPSQLTVATAILSISKVSSKDFPKELKCVGRSRYMKSERSLTLRSGGSLTPVFVGGVCVLVLCAAAVFLVKLFIVDIKLLLRPYLPTGDCNKAADVRQYDALVLCETQKAGEKQQQEAALRLAAFMDELVSVLEKQCRYRLFIQHRDSLPGEDRVAQVQRAIEQSRSLMLVISDHPESSNQQPDSSPHLGMAGFDWQAGLHHALTRHKMAVIVIQVGQTGAAGYAHLSMTLRHLLAKNAPLKWSPKSRLAATRHSRFWKKVRYLMPTRPAAPAN
ncbi:interleukin-1 receptor type 1 [Syngnathoides biaculeatus]|uniref:interleukin-1 receptor type 1 n=1 Tax=Syngnathoides biaculeatus TaxID=300417 RepID=UPI002ADDCCF5|nr:interleukin-1 receptor type 1 [Syngnathoides biaculeatus]